MSLIWAHPQLEIAAGIVDVKDPRVQTAAELRHLAEQLLTVVPAARLLLCPSCGLGRRIVELALARVTAMVAAADRSEVDDPALRCLLW